jgi:hypothetical protein
MHRDRTRAELSRPAAQKTKVVAKSTGSTRLQTRTATAQHDERADDLYVDDEVLRARVRQCIQQRVLERQSMETMPQVPADKPVETPFMASLHPDVVQTAAQILGKYLANAYQSDEPLELALVHRMLVKEVELQALQHQRTLT